MQIFNQYQGLKQLEDFLMKKKRKDKLGMNLRIDYKPRLTIGWE